MMHNLRCCLNHFRKQELSNEVRRVNSIDNGIFIHAIVPRHVETVVLLRRENVDGYVEIDLEIEKQCVKYDKSVLVEV